jgi:circadian clock protein KaiC
MSMPQNPNPSQERLTSGIAQLDTVLHGGFVRGGIHLLMGPPGAGKTILSNQICFHHVANGGKAVYLTLLAESHAATLAHLGGFSFFQPQLVGEKIFYFSAYPDLDQHGPSGLLEFVRQIVRDEQPSLLMLDGLATLQAHAESQLDLKRFVHQLQVYAESYGCTIFLITHISIEPQSSPEYTMVDGLLRMSYQLVGSRAVRELQVLKLRGSSFSEGKHIYEFSTDGIVVYPRLESNSPVEPGAQVEVAQRRALGMPQFDAMLRGGLPARSATMLMGPPGSGKTLLGLRFLSEGARQAQPGLYVGFGETPAELVEKADMVGFDLSAHLSAGRIKLLWQTPGELLLDKISAQILAAAQALNAQRIFLDGLEGLRSAAVYPERFLRMLTVLLDILRSRGATTIFSAELPTIIGPQLNIPLDPASAIAGNIILLRHVELRTQNYRLISILKMRQSGHDRSIREFRITDAGIEVADNAMSAEAILSGTAKPISAEG